MRFDPLTALHRFGQSKRGATSIIFAVLIPCLLAAAGLAIDAATVYNRKSKYDAAADAAIVAALAAARNSVVSGPAANWQAEAETAGRATFNAANVQGLRGSIDVLQFSFEQSKNTFKGTLAYKASYKTFLMSIFHFPSLEIDNTVSASYSIPNYLDVHLLIDVSPSMGIGASAADQTALYNATISPATGIGCALGCHYSSPYGDTHDIARANNVRMRIDVVRDAVRKFILDLKAKETKNDQVRISINLFSNELIPLFALSTNLDAAYAASANIDLTNLPNNGGTNITNALQRLAATAPAGGDGYNSNRRKSYLVLMTDGIEDSVVENQPIPAGTWPAQHWDPNWVMTPPTTLFFNAEELQTFDPAMCASAKSAGHTVMTGRIEYRIPTTPDAASAAPRFNYIQNTLLPLLPGKMAACASDPSYSFAAVESADIQPMMDDILEAIFAPSELKLTQ